MIIEKVKKFIIDKNLINPNDKIIVGFSGGPDSVFLLYFLNILRKDYNLDLVAVHINHSIRKSGAREDEEFSRDFCKELDIDFVVYKENVPKYAKEFKLSIEDAGRQLRYNAFNKEAEKVGNNCKIAVAHHKDDVAETILLNIIRGTGNKGLIGIEEKNGNIIRPILNLNKREILGFLDTNKIPYIEDLSNYENDYSRNRIRNEFIPYIKNNYNTNIVNNLINMSKIIREEYNFIEDYCDSLNLIRKESNYIYIDIDELMLQPIAIKRNIIFKAYEILNGSRKDLSFDNINTILELLNKDSASFIIKNYRIYSYNRKLIFNRIEDNRKSSFINFIIGDKIYFGDYIINSEIIDYSSNLKSKYNISYFNLEIFNKILTLRNRQDGDYINLEGFKKKIKDILIDNKVDRYERDNIPILTYENEVLWILGIRRSNLYKINNKMDKVIKISFERE